MDFKTSLLVNRQVPEFVREEYPLFISFLEAYYEFLETEIINDDNTSQNNNLIERAKKLREVSNIDVSLEDFEENFFNSFAYFLPRNVNLDKTFLLKNVLPLYKSKGTLKSFQFLFKLLFNEEIKAEYPKNNVLKVSDGKWVIDNVLRVNLETYNKYVSDGLQNTFYLPYIFEKNQIRVTVDNVSVDDFVYRKELRKIILNDIPPEDSIVKIQYLLTINPNIFVNRQVRGIKSEATALIENVGRRNIAGQNFFQFFIDNKTKSKEFITGELISTDVIIDDVVIPFEFQTFSEIQNINIIEPGSNYTIGDRINFLGNSVRESVALVSEVSSGKIKSLIVDLENTGFGYKKNNEVKANNINSNSFYAIVDSVDTSGTYSPNTISYNIIDYIDGFEFLSIDSPNYGLNLSFSSNINSKIEDCLNNSIVEDLGPAINVKVLVGEVTNNLNIDFITNSTNLYDDVDILDLGSIASINILDGGQNYSVGDKIIFKNNRNYFSGQGANAYVSKVDTNGSIQNITVVNGGFNYSKQYLPKILVDSEGSGANLSVGYFMGEGLSLDYERGDGKSGKILKIDILDRGSGYEFIPIPDLTNFGDGNAILQANVSSSYISLPGRWATTDGLLSSDEMRLQGKNYYIDFSYVLTSKIEFQRYKSIVKQLLNPSGFINYARYDFQDTINLPFDFDVSSNLTREIAGVMLAEAGGHVLYGVNSQFIIANTIPIIGEGTYIIVNSDIRIVNGIINSTTITVSEPFSEDIINTSITIFTPDYNGITTEYWRELATMSPNNKFIVLETEE